LKDLSKIPLITKKELTDVPLERLLAKRVNPKECTIYTTSGSSGLPLKVFQSKIDRSYSNARSYYAFLECGQKPTDKHISLLVPTAEMRKHWFNKLGFFRKDVISIRQPIEKVINELSIKKPDSISSFPSIYFLLTQHMDIRKVKPRLIFSTGENLDENIREKVDKTFNVKLFNLYGTVETRLMAFECCEHVGLHVITDHHLIEFLKDGEPASLGEEGEIVVTSLHNYTMPFIRYRLMDFGVLSDDFCSCGRTYPLIKYIEGRQDDFLTLPSGRVISPRNVWRSSNNPIIRSESISEFQIIQEKKDKFLVNVVKGRGFSNNTIPDIIKTIKSGCLGEEVSVDVKVVDRIERGRSGKIKSVISKV
jgi:phenylacetate-CoA ligase